MLCNMQAAIVALFTFGTFCSIFFLTILPLPLNILNARSTNINVEFSFHLLVNLLYPSTVLLANF